MNSTAEIGKPAPDIQVDTWVQGGPANFGSLRGRVVLVEVFQVNCPGCFVHALPQVVYLHERYEAQGLTVIGLATAFGEVYYGASTAGGYPASVSSGSVPIDDRFTDLASNTSWPVPGPPPATFMGSVLPTRNLIYFNL